MPEVVICAGLSVGCHGHKDQGATVWGCSDLTVWLGRQKIKPVFLIADGR